MTILMTTDTVGGVWVYSVELCRMLSQYNVQIHLAALGAWPSVLQETEIEKIPGVMLYKSDYKLEWMQDPWDDLEQTRKWLNAIYHTVQPDLVHFNNYAHIEPNWQAPVITVFHSCVQTWWQAVKGSAAPDQWNQYTQIVQDSLEASDLVIAPTKAILEKAKSTHHFSTEATVIHNGREAFSCEGVKKEAFILGMGRIWDEAKNLNLLSSIANHLSWPVYIAGDAVNPNSGKHSQLDNITFLGKLSPAEVRDWMQRASIFVSPTRYEPFGLAILEAAGAGCALVLSNLETLRELWQDAALFFDPENENEAEDILVRLIQDPAFLSEMAGKAKEMSGNYCAEKMGRSYLDMYKSVLTKQKKKRIAV